MSGGGGGGADGRMRDGRYASRPPAGGAAAERTAALQTHLRWIDRAVVAWLLAPEKGAVMDGRNGGGGRSYGPAYRGAQRGVPIRCTESGGSSDCPFCGVRTLYGWDPDGALALLAGCPHVLGSAAAGGYEAETIYRGDPAEKARARAAGGRPKGAKR